MEVIKVVVPLTSSGPQEDSPLPTSMTMLPPQSTLLTMRFPFLSYKATREWENNQIGSWLISLGLAMTDWGRPENWTSCIRMCTFTLHICCSVWSVYEKQTKIIRTGYGFLMEGGYRTMMAYTAPGHRRRIPFYSSPVFNQMFFFLTLSTLPLLKIWWYFS